MALGKVRIIPALYFGRFFVRATCIHGFTSATSHHYYYSFDHTIPYNTLPSNHASHHALSRLSQSYRMIGIRVYKGRILSLDKHLKRLFKSAKGLGFSKNNIHSKEEIVEAIFRTLAVNGMRDGAHMRLTLTRGEKCTSSMNPDFNVYGTTLIILAEWKPTEGKVRIQYAREERFWCCWFWFCMSVSIHSFYPPHHDHEYCTSLIVLLSLTYTKYQCMFHFLLSNRLPMTIQREYH